MTANSTFQGEVSEELRMWNLDAQLDNKGFRMLMVVPKERFWGMSGFFGMIPPFSRTFNFE